MAFLGVAPTGTVLPFAGSVAPEGWALCDGSAINRNTYEKLFLVISTAYGTGDGVNTFNLPDMRGVFPRGAGTNGTSNYGGVTGHTPAGGSVATKNGQKTAKNGLTASAGTSSLSALTLNSVTTTVSGAKNQMNGGTGGMSANASHTHIINAAGFGVASTGGVFGVAGSNGSTSSSSTNVDHSHSWDFGGATFSAAGTTPAQTLSSSTVAAQPITVGAGDTETTPASLSLNYIIKL